VNSRVLRVGTWLALIAVAVVFIRMATRDRVAPVTLSNTDFWTYAEDNRIVKVAVDQDKGRATGLLVDEKNQQKKFIVLSLGVQENWEPLLQKIRRDQVKAGRDSVMQYEIVPRKFSDSIINLFITLAITGALFVVFWMFIMRQAQSSGTQALSFGRSRAKRITEGMQRVTFDDVAGVDEAKEELTEVVDFLKNPKKFQALGARIPRGVLLLGPPGAGKTLLARAVAGEAGVPFFHISGSDFVEMFVGVGASRVRDLFEQAKANRPCIIFIDEIDAVGRQRFAGLGGGHDEREQTLNQLLVEMDGFDPNSGVILLAATNRPDVLDPALLRPGRFDRRIVVDHADLKGRKLIMELYIKGKPIDDDVDAEVLARRTPGFSGADIANMVNEAALLAARNDRKRVSMSDFEASIDRVIAGPERRSRIISDREKRIVAYHEVGHAIVGEVLPHADPVHKIGIVRRGMALGYTMRLPIEDRYLVGREQLLEDITAALGGRAAEEMVFGDITTGESDDLVIATGIARRMVAEFGMSDEVGPVSLIRHQHPPFLGRDIMEDRTYSERMAESVDREVRRIIDECYQRAKQILDEHREEMERVVNVLLEKETLERTQFRELMGLPPEPAPAPEGPQKPEPTPEATEQPLPDQGPAPQTA